MNNNKKVLIGIIASVVVIAIAAGVLVIKFNDINWFGGKGKKSESTSQSGANNSKGADGKTDKDSGSGNSTDIEYNFETIDTGKKTIDVTDVKASVSSNQIEVPIYATKNPGMVAALLTLTYDSDAFTFADCAAGDIFDTCEGNFDEKTKTLKIIAQNNGDGNGLNLISGAGIIGKVILKPTSKAKAGTYKISVKTEAADLNEKLVDVKAEAGNIVLS